MVLDAWFAVMLMGMCQGSDSRGIVGSRREWGREQAGSGCWDIHTAAPWPTAAWQGPGGAVGLGRGFGNNELVGHQRYGRGYGNGATAMGPRFRVVVT